MAFKQKIIDFLFKVSFINSYFRGIGVIFMLHRVAPLEKYRLFPNERNMKVPPEFLEEFIVELKKEGYAFISLDELHEILQKHEKVRKCIVFTLDDGYKDNFKIAYPIFKKYEVPFAIYITTSFPNKTAYLWWYALEDLILKNDEIVVGNRKYNCKTWKKKNQVFLEVRNRILKLDQKNLKKELKNFFGDYNIDWSAYAEKLCLSWSEIKDLSRDDICTIGSHTVNHYALNKLKDEEIAEEVLIANREIENYIGKRVEHFAYPFGGPNEIGKREVEILKRLGFKTCVTTRTGTIYPEHKNYLECLPRIMLTTGFNISDIGRIRKKRVVTL